MNRMMSALAVAAVVTGAACSRTNGKPADSALNTDLSLAAQQKGYTPLDTVSAAERARANALAAAPGAVVAPVAGTTNRATRHTASTVRHSNGGSSSAGSSSNGTYGSAPAPVYNPPTHVVKHTQRDAAIGAAAGAVIGATTSGNKVKGGIIGAAVGGILGGVIGNNVDKKRVP